MGTLKVMTTPRMAMLTVLLFTLKTVVALSENPCRGMTVANCEISEDNIINRYNFNAAICESQCKRSDHCQFWRVYQNESMELLECIHLRTNYHQDCITFAGPIDGNINSCLDTDLTTCSAYIEEECQYTGERLYGLEPPPEDVSSIHDCQEWAKEVESLGAENFYFSGVTEECQIFADMQSSCYAIGGPATAPPLEECEESCPHPWTFLSHGCYLFLTGPLNWADAKNTCEDLHGHLGHGHLVKIETEEENEELYNKAVSLNMTTGTWIGLNDIAEEGNWVWTDGTRVDFTNWSTDQPSNGGGKGEDCAVLNTFTSPTNPGGPSHLPKKWNDGPCDFGMVAICELNV